VDNGGKEYTTAKDSRDEIIGAQQNAVHCTQKNKIY
jgi:hypothetical protein